MPPPCTHVGSRSGRFGAHERPWRTPLLQDHEWVQAEGGLVRIGITDYAQDALGDVVFVQLPERRCHVEAGVTLGEIESTKSVSEIYAPLAGR